MALAQNLNSDYDNYWTQAFAKSASVNATFYSDESMESESGLSGADLYHFPNEQ